MHPVFRYKFIFPIGFFLVAACSLSGQGLSAITPRELTFAEAMHIAIGNSPELKALYSEEEAAKGLVQQADTPPNPVLSAEMENFLGSGPWQNAESLELSLGIRQTIETAGKRKKRAALARSETDLLAWERADFLNELESRVKQVFAESLLRHELVILRDEQLELAKRNMDETRRLYEAARAPQVELSRAQLAVQQQKFALLQAENKKNQSHAALASRIGLPPSSDLHPIGEVILESELPTLEELFAVLPETAAIGRYHALQEQRKADLELHQAQARPDWEIFAGGRYFNEDEGNAAFVAGVDIPWPVFNRNKGNIRAARARLQAVEHQRLALRKRLSAQLIDAWQELKAAYTEAAIVADQLLPAAEASLADAEAGYQQGQFTQLAVLESRRALFESRELYFEALSRYILAKAEIESLTRPANFTVHP